MNQKGFIPIVFIIVGAVVLASAIFGVVKYGNKLTASVADIFKKSEIQTNNTKPEEDKNAEQTSISLSQETETSKQNQSTSTCTGNLCNGVCYVNCPVGQNFYCLNSGGACCSSERYCNGQCWADCSTGIFRCPADGNAYCENASSNKIVDISNEIVDMFNENLEMTKGLIDSMKQMNEQVLLDIAIRAKQRDEEYNRIMAEFKQKQDELIANNEAAKAEAAVIENNPIYIKCEQNISVCAGSDLTEWMKMNSKLILIWNKVAIAAGGTPYIVTAPQKEGFSYSSGATMPTIISPNGLGGWNITKW